MDQRTNPIDGRLCWTIRYCLKVFVSIAGGRGEDYMVEAMQCAESSLRTWDPSRGKSFKNWLCYRARQRAKDLSRSVDYYPKSGRPRMPMTFAAPPEIDHIDCPLDRMIAAEDVQRARKHATPGALRTMTGVSTWKAAQQLDGTTKTGHHRRCQVVVRLSREEQDNA